MALATIQTAPDGATAEVNGDPTRLVAAELARVDQRILELVASDVEPLRSLAEELVLSGGKRVRPALILLVYRAAGGRDPSDAIDVGAAIELIHSATLLHDDILDRAPTRRGHPSALARHGEALTLVAGDFLFSRAFSVAGRFDAQVVSWAAEACVQLCEGEVLQQRSCRSAAANVATWEQIAGRKTASLFAQAARIGAHFAGAPESVVAAMQRLGFEIGIVFQMIDDLLDITGPESVIGKPLAGDLREGIPALPVVLGCATLPAVRTAFLSSSPTAEQIDAAIAALHSSEIPTIIRAAARARVAQARADLHQLAQSSYRDALDELLDRLVGRAS